MTFTIDESVIALWPWAAGVAYFAMCVIVARSMWRVWRSIPLPSHREYKGDDTPLAFQALMVGIAAIFGSVVIVPGWALTCVVTWRNGD